MAAPPKRQQTWVDVVQPFAIGGLSGMSATAVIQPIDTVKVRIQIESEAAGAAGKAGGAKPNLSPFHIANDIKAKEGVRGLYKGLDAALIRQATYATARLGIYKTISDNIKAKHPTTDLTLWEKTYSSIIAGFLGSLIGNPSDLILVRFQSDGHLPPAERRNYKNFFDALTRIIREEGVLTLWRGSAPTVVRAIAVNVGTLAPYDEVKDRLNKITGTKDALSTRLTASAVAGIVGSVMCLPPDNLKTKLQKMKAGPDGKLPYSGLLDCTMKSVQREGVLKLWVGLPTFYFRVAPHAMITLLVQDYLTDFAKRARGIH